MSTMAHVVTWDRSTNRPAFEEVELGYKVMTAKEVMEDDLVCGIELCPSDDVATVSTKPVSEETSSWPVSDGASSWSLSSLEVTASTSDEDDVGIEPNHGFSDSRGVESDIIPGPGTPLYCRKSNRAGWSRKGKRPPDNKYNNFRLEKDKGTVLRSTINPFDVRDLDADLSGDENYGPLIEDNDSDLDPIIWVCEVPDTDATPRHSNVAQDSTINPLSAPEITSLTTEIRNVGIINVMDPVPSDVFAQLFRINYSTLCQMTLASVDEDTFRICQPKRNTEDTGVPRSKHRLPFVMFPEKHPVVVSKDAAANFFHYHMTSCGPISASSLAQLFNIQGPMLEGRKITVSSVAYGDTIPAFLGAPDPLSMGPAPLRIRLSKWRRSLKELKATAAKQLSTVTMVTSLGSRSEEGSTSSFDTPLRHLELGLQNVMNEERAITETTRLGKIVEFVGESSIIQDDELRAVMEMTENGNDTSALFPSFSDDLDSDCDCSDDGLDGELGNLGSIESELRMELEVAETVIKGVVEAQRALSEAEESSTFYTGEPSSFDDDHTTDSLQDVPLAAAPQYQRRVRFSTHNEEYIFDAETTDSEDRSSRSGSTKTDLEDALEELYYVLEDMMDDLSCICFQGKRPTPSQHQGGLKMRNRYSS